MRFALNRDHKDFYAKSGFIEFQKLLSAEAVEALSQEISQVLAARLHTSKPYPFEKNQKEIFLAGFDLWRESPLIKKTLFKTAFSHIASELFQTPFLRVGYDQYIDTRDGSHPPFHSTCSFNSFSCAHPLAGVMILSLSTPIKPSYNPQDCPIPSEEGSCIFLSPEIPVSWDLLFSQKDARLLIFTFGVKTTFYRLHKQDPQTHAWKRLGYVFGDLLNDALHPILDTKH